MSNKELLCTILTHLTKEFQKLEYLLSLTFVGSGKRLVNIEEYDNLLYQMIQHWKVLDLDFVIIVDRLNNLKIKEINSLFKKIRQCAIPSNIKVTYEKRVGPIKLVTQRDPQIMFHRLLFDERLYREYCQINKLTPFNWQFHAPILGRSLREICEIKGITKKDLLESRSGIKHFINMIETRTINPLLLRKSGPQYKYVTTSVNLGEQHYTKLILDSVIRCAGNLLKLHKPVYIEDEFKVGRLFQQTFGETKLKELPLLFAYYKNLMNCTPFKPIPDFIDFLRKQSLMFLREIRRYLEN